MFLFLCVFFFRVSLSFFFQKKKNEFFKYCFLYTASPFPLTLLKKVFFQTRFHLKFIILHTDGCSRFCWEFNHFPFSSLLAFPSKKFQRGKDDMILKKILYIKRSFRKKKTHAVWGSSSARGKKKCRPFPS